MDPGRTRLTVSEQARATALRLRLLCASAQTAKAPLPALLAFGKPHLPSNLHALDGFRAGASCLRQTAPALQPALGRATDLSVGMDQDGGTLLPEIVQGALY